MMHQQAVSEGASAKVEETQRSRAEKVCQYSIHANNTK